MTLLPSLTEQEKSYYLLLNSMRKQDPSDKEYSFVKTIVQFSSSPVLLSMIIACPKWYDTVAVKEALSQNAALPTHFQDYLRQVLMVVDLFREMGTDDADARARTMEQARDQIAKLKEADREFLKRLISDRLRPTPCDDPDPVFEERVQQIHQAIFLAEQDFGFASLTEEEKAVRAKTSNDSKELKELLRDGDRKVWETALKNRFLTESDVLEAIQTTQNEALLRETYGFPRWFFKDRVRDGLLANAHTPSDVRSAIESSRVAIQLFERLAKLKRNMAERNNTAIEIAEHLKHVPELELQYITVVVKRRWPALLSVIKAFYFFTQKKSATGKPAVEELEQTERLSATTVEDLIRMAATTDSEKEMAVLLQHPDLNVFRNLLSNPHLDESMLAGTVHMLTEDQLLILEHSRFKDSHAIRDRMVHNPNLPQANALEIVQSFDNMKDLLDVIRDPKIASVEVKNTAFNRLSAMYRSLPTAEKAETICRTNGEIFRELWSEIFKDADVLTTLITEFDPTPETVVRIIHSRLTPLPVLEQIIERGVHLDNAGVVLEFYNNPKVTNDMILKLQGKLSDSMKQLLAKRGLYRTS